MTNKKEEIKQKTEDKTVFKSKGDEKNLKDFKVKIETLKKENKTLREQIINLVNQVNELKLSHENSIKAFQEKAKGFQAKAQLEVNKVKEELRKKTEKENADFKKYGMQKTFENMIEPLINIEVAIKAGKGKDPKVQSYVMGFEMLMTQLMTELESSGLSKIEPKVGDEFDPEIHQAISKEDGETNKILKVKKAGFKLYDRVIKPATVVIG